MASPGTSFARRILRAAVLACAVGVGGCYYYGPAPYASMSTSFDRSWDAAAGAIVDNGFSIVSQDRGTGAIIGRCASSGSIPSRVSFEALIQAPSGTGTV